MTSLNIPERLEKDFARLAREKNIPAADLMVTVLAAYLAEQEDIRAADEVMARIQSGEDVPSGLLDVRRELGL